jgi:hypothetical protein
MEEALTEEQIQKLDGWLADHNTFTPDARKGDGTSLYCRWKDYGIKQTADLARRAYRDAG